VGFEKNNAMKSIAHIFIVILLTVCAPRLGIALFGTYTIDEVKHRLVQHVEALFFPT
jgi:hypothetical protein